VKAKFENWVVVHVSKSFENSDKFGFCPKCFSFKLLTKHHVFPRRFFGNSSYGLHICRECHDDIEKVIPAHQKLTKSEYIELTKCWLLGVRYWD
jgi:hypothetical protein